MTEENDKPKRLRDSLGSKKLRDLLDQPVGSPLPITREEAIEIVKAGIGGRPDLPSGKEYVRRVRRMWRGFLLPRE